MCSKIVFHTCEKWQYQIKEIIVQMIVERVNLGRGRLLKQSFPQSCLICASEPQGLFAYWQPMRWYDVSDVNQPEDVFHVK